MRVEHAVEAGIELTTEVYGKEWHLERTAGTRDGREARGARGSAGFEGGCYARLACAEGGVYGEGPQPLTLDADAGSKVARTRGTHTPAHPHTHTIPIAPQAQWPAAHTTARRTSAHPPYIRGGQYRHTPSSSRCVKSGLRPWPRERQDEGAHSHGCKIPEEIGPISSATHRST